MLNFWSLTVATLVGLLAIASASHAQQENEMLSLVRMQKTMDNEDTIMVPQHMWMTIVNTSIDNGNGTFTRGDTASIEYGDTLRVVNRDGDNALVELIARRRDAYGALAPVRSLFLVRINELSTYNVKYREVTNGKSKMNAYLDKLIDGIDQ